VSFSHPYREFSAPPVETISSTPQKVEDRKTLDESKESPVGVTEDLQDRRQGDTENLTPTQETHVVDPSEIANNQENGSRLMQESPCLESIASVPLNSPQAATTAISQSKLVTFLE